MNRQSEAHVALGGSTAITPAHARAGAWVEVAPVSVFVVRVGAEPGQFLLPEALEHSEHGEGDRLQSHDD
jgi:hypothetical protein